MPLYKRQMKSFQKVVIRHLHQSSWIGGDAELLPFENSSFDVYTTAFCMRNVTDLNQALREANRILKPGGQFLCLEFSHMILPSMAKIYDAYSLNLLPIMGQIFANDKALSLAKICPIIGNKLRE